MREREDVGRNQAVGERSQKPPIGVAIIGHDQVEIEHQPFELVLPRHEP